MWRVCAANVRDAAVTASVQRIIHYKIAGYGAIAAYAKALGREEDAAHFAQLADRDKAVDAELSELAKGTLNPEATAAPQGEQRPREELGAHALSVRKARIASFFATFLRFTSTTSLMSFFSSRSEQRCHALARLQFQLFAIQRNRAVERDALAVDVQLVERDRHEQRGRDDHAAQLRVRRQRLRRIAVRNRVTPAEPAFALRAAIDSAIAADASASATRSSARSPLGFQPSGSVIINSSRCGALDVGRHRHRDVAHAGSDQRVIRPRVDRDARAARRRCRRPDRREKRGRCGRCAARRASGSAAARRRSRARL